MLKRIVSLFLSLAIILSFSMNSLAVGLETSSSVDAQIEQEIEMRKQEIYDIVYPQLVAQNATELMSVYEAILYPEAEAEIRASYESRSVSRAITSYNVGPYGGMVQYKFDSPDGSVTDVVSVGLDYDNSYYYILSSNSFSLKTIIESIVGFIPYVGTFASVIFTMNTVTSSLAMNSVKEAGGFAKIVSTYNSPSGAKASVLMGWTNRYNLSVTESNAYSIKITKFEYHNPWE